MPEPCHLVAFDQLISTAQGTKVRFLACVQSYDTQNARLALNDSHTAADKSGGPPVLVQIDNILENVSRELLEVGAWINVVGTIRGHEDVFQSSKSGRRTRHTPKKVSSPIVDATMIWPAGAIRLEEYRASVQAYQHALAST